MSIFSPNRIRIALGLLLLFAGSAGCEARWGPPRDVSRFDSAAIAEDGRLGVFTYKHRVYRPASGWRAFPDGGPAKDVVNENGVASYDPQSGEVRVLWRQNIRRSRWLPEARCSVAAVAGSRALVVCGGQRRSDYEQDAERFWIDLDSGATEPLPLARELADRDRRLGVLYLLDPVGTLALVLPLPDHPQGTRKLEPVRELLIRLPGGEYLKVGEIIHYYGYRDGEVHFWSADNRHMVYRPESRTLRDGSYKEYLALSETNAAGPTRHFTVSYIDGSWRLQWGRKISGEWSYETLPMTVAEVAARKGP